MKPMDDQTFNEICRSYRVPINPQFELGKKILKNTFNCLKWSYACPGFESMLGKLKGLPCVVVSPGPSLKKNLHILRDYQDKVVIIAVARCIRELDEAGIRPHIIMQVEARDFAYFFKTDESRGLPNDAKNLDRAIFVLLDQVHPAFWQAGRPIITAQMCTNWVTNWTKLSFKELDHRNFASSGSVTSLACQVGLFAGCSSISFIGMDLAFAPDGSFYAHKSNVRNENDKKAPEIEVPGYFGGMVKTTPTMFRFIDWFRTFIPDYTKRFPETRDVKWFDCTEGGAAKPHLKQVKFEYVAREFFTKRVPDDCNASHLFATFKAPFAFSRIDKQRKATLKRLDKMFHFHSRIQLMEKNYRDSVTPKRLTQLNREFTRLVNAHKELSVIIGNEIKILKQMLTHIKSVQDAGKWTPKLAKDSTVHFAKVYESAANKTLLARYVFG